MGLVTGKGRHPCMCEECYSKQEKSTPLMASLQRATSSCASRKERQFQSRFFSVLCNLPERRFLWPGGWGGQKSAVEPKRLLCQGQQGPSLGLAPSTGGWWQRQQRLQPSLWRRQPSILIGPDGRFVLRGQAIAGHWGQALLHLRDRDASALGETKEHGASLRQRSRVPTRLGARVGDSMPRTDSGLLLSDSRFLRVQGQSHLCAGIGKDC